MTQVLKGLAKRTAASNRAFAKMTDAQKRVSIAEDVIAALAPKQIKPTNGEYLFLKSGKYGRTAIGGEINGLTIHAEKTPRLGFQELLPKLPPCQVCAKGAIFVCTVARRNAVTTKAAADQGWNGETLSATLGGIFPPDMLEAIECEFEGYRDEGNWPQRAAPRMRRIMENIVKHDGEFVPTDS